MLVASHIVNLLVPWCTAQAIDLLQHGEPDAELTCLKRIAAIVGILVALGGLVAVTLTIVAFDQALMRLAQIENKTERSLSAAMLDCLGNSTTVLSLRLQQATRRQLPRRLEAVVAPRRRSIVLTE